MTLDGLEALAKEVIAAHAENERGDGMRLPAALDAFDYRATPETILALTRVVRAAQIAVDNNGIPYPPTTECGPKYAGPMNNLADELTALTSHIEKE